MDEFYEIQYWDIKEDSKYNEIIGTVIKECFKVENLLDSKLYVSITLTNPENIRKFNKQYRNIDKETDVLSFPNLNKKYDQKLSEFDSERNFDDIWQNNRKIINRVFWIYC